METFFFFFSAILIGTAIAVNIMFLAYLVGKYFSAPRCPHCGKVLHKSKDTRQYETLIEHVSPPESGEIPQRHYYKCRNKKCYISDKLFWDLFGDHYCEKGVGRDFTRWIMEQENNGKLMETKKVR